jgi:hypothetical protein
MRERVARRLVIVAAALAATGTLLLAGGGCGRDASEMDDAVAPASPNIAFTFAGGSIYGD